MVKAAGLFRVLTRMSSRLRVDWVLFLVAGFLEEIFLHGIIFIKILIKIPV